MSGEEDLISVSQFCEHWWTEIAKKARRAVVFIDDPSAECLHWNGGIQRLLQAGAEDIKVGRVFAEKVRTS